MTKKRATLISPVQFQWIKRLLSMQNMVKNKMIKSKWIQQLLHQDYKLKLIQEVILLSRKILKSKRKLNKNQSNRKNKWQALLFTMILNSLQSLQVKLKNQLLNNHSLRKLKKFLKISKSLKLMPFQSYKKTFKRKIQFSMRT